MHGSMNVKKIVYSY